MVILKGMGDILPRDVLPRDILPLDTSYKDCKNYKILFFYVF